MARKILLADDSVTAQNMGRKILSDAGYDVVTVNNGSAALKRVAEQRPDLIVLDVYMPGYSGLEVCQRLKDSPETAEIPILLTVGKLEPFKPEEARRVRAEAYIVKPFEASELLSAMTRLEDQMVPGGVGGSRKSDSNGDPETGWKNRLRFPSKKKKEEPEPELGEDFVGGPTFREFRRGRGRGRTASANETVPNTAASVVPDIPRDITPEELDALSALAAKLDSEAPKAPEAVALAEKVAESPAAVSPATSEPRPEFAVAAPVVQEATAEIPAVQVEATEAAKEDVEPAVESDVAEPTPVAQEPELPQTTPVPVETLRDQEQAPLAQKDEPIFATAPFVEPASEVKSEVQAAPAASVEAPVVASVSETAQGQAASQEPTSAEAPVEEEPKPADTTAEAPKVEEAPVTATVPETGSEPEGPAPSEEELAAALRLLTPSAAGPDSSAMPSRETLVTMGAILAEEVTGQVAPQWMAKAVPVSREEAALSLEEEMFKTRSTPAQLAEAEVVQRAEPPSEATPVLDSSDVAMQRAETPETVAVPADTIAATPVEAVETAASTAKAEPAPAFVESKLAVDELPPAEEPAPATFADAVRVEETSPAAEVSAAPVTAALAANEAIPVAETTAVAASEAAGEDDMSKERRKSGKSNWHQIRTEAPAAESTDVVEAAKQTEPTAEEAPKTMAAAAATQGTPAPGTPADPSAIASIVDSVLSDLRPKIVEEIAKKLAGK